MARIEPNLVEVIERGGGAYSREYERDRDDMRCTGGCALTGGARRGIVTTESTTVGGYPGGLFLC